MMHLRAHAVAPHRQDLETRPRGSERSPHTHQGCQCDPGPRVELADKAPWTPVPASPSAEEQARLRCSNTEHVCENPALGGPEASA